MYIYEKRMPFHPLFVSTPLQVSNEQESQDDAAPVMKMFPTIAEDDDAENRADGPEYSRSRGNIPVDDWMSSSDSDIYCLETQQNVNKKEEKQQEQLVTSSNHSQVVEDSDYDRPITPTQKYHTATAPASVQVAEKSQDLLITFSDNDGPTPPCSPDFVYSLHQPKSPSPDEPPLLEEEESSHNSSDICYSEIPSPIISRGRQVPRKYQASPDMFKSDSDDNPTPPCSPPAGYNQAPIKSDHDSADTDRTEPSSPPAYFYQETPEKRLKMGKHLA